jgi:hypothetical protein
VGCRCCYNRQLRARSSYKCSGHRRGIQRNCRCGCSTPSGAAARTDKQCAHDEDYRSHYYSSLLFFRRTDCPTSSRKIATLDRSSIGVYLTECGGSVAECARSHRDPICSWCNMIAGTGTDVPVDTTEHDGVIALGVPRVGCALKCVGVADTRPGPPRTRFQTAQTYRVLKVEPKTSLISAAALPPSPAKRQAANDTDDHFTAG